MNRSELIAALKAKAGISSKEAKVVVETFFDQITHALGNGGKVEIRGLCSFKVRKYRPYTGRNPKTGERIPVKSKKLPFFKAGKELRDMVNGMAKNT